MTEREWLACVDPEPMLQLLQGKTSSRKLRLFACACCRKVWHLLPDDNNRKAVEVAESFADGVVPDKERASARKAPGLWAVVKEATAPNRDLFKMARRCAWYARLIVANAGSEGFDHQEGIKRHYAAIEAEQLAQAVLVRDVFGTPFRGLTIAPSCLAWQGGLLRRLAAAAYEERQLPSGLLRPDRLAVLADALEEAGCDNRDILTHCRQDGEHIRGCWVVDALVGKS